MTSVIRVRILPRHIEACRGTVSCPVSLALREALPGHSVHIGGACAHIDGAPVHLPADVYEWCAAWDRGRRVEPFAFEFDPSKRPERDIPGIYAKAGAA
jgi:hypothetical protein